MSESWSNLFTACVIGIAIAFAVSVASNAYVTHERLVTYRHCIASKPLLECASLRV